MKKRKSLSTTIRIAMLALVILILAVIFTVIGINLYSMQKTISVSNRRLGDKASEISSASIEDEVLSKLMELAQCQANIVDSNFGHFKTSVELLASDATYLYEHADEYGRIPVDEPRAENDGKLVVHITHSKNTDMSDPAVIDEAGLLGNESNTLISTHAGNPSMAKCYIATESGLMIEADEDSSDKLEDDGSVKFYEPTERPWYYETKELNATHFTNVTPEASGKRTGFMCGSPVTKNGKFMGVACAGMYLDDVNKIVQSTNLGEYGIACIINNNGQLLFSSQKEGELSITKETAGLDLRNSSNPDLAKLATDAVNGYDNYRTVHILGKDYCVAFAGMDTVGWSFVIMLPEEIVQEPTNRLLNELSIISGETETYAKNSILRVTIIFAITGVLSLILAFVLAYRISKIIALPVIGLTEKVSSLHGDNLDFEWYPTTEYEIQALAEAFMSLTGRIKNYIEEVKQITAEKERIGAELSVATEIQANMLPNIFPPFPNRKEFELYALMDPAKEVGGDFYDFFFVDDKHLALVVADVSGKGVPAALFMVIAKTLIKNRALMGGSPAEILGDVNNQLCEGNEADLFVTVWFAIIDLTTGKGIEANAGHEHPAIRRKDGNFELIQYKHSLAVATMEDIRFREHEFELHPGDTLFQYSDGVPEATSIDEKLFGDELLINSLNKNPNAAPDELISIVRNDIDTFVDTAPQFDDITMLCFKYFGDLD